MSKTKLQTSRRTWTHTEKLLREITVDQLIVAKNWAQDHQPISDPGVKELLRMVMSIGSTAPGSDEKKSCMLAQLKSSIVYHGCPIIFLTINPGERHSPLALFYAGTPIDIKNFCPKMYIIADRLKTMLENPLAVVEYFHNTVRAIIEGVLKGRMFGELVHFYGPVEYQGRGTPHIHLAVRISMPLSTQFTVD